MPDKSIAQKLFIKEGYKVLLINTPEGYESTLGELPKNVTLLTVCSQTKDRLSPNPSPSHCKGLLL